MAQSNYFATNEIYVVECWSFKSVLSWRYYYYYLFDQQISIKTLENEVILLILFPIVLLVYVVEVIIITIYLINNYVV